MQTVKAIGQLKHHFWSDYRASLVLVFDDNKAAQDALLVLGTPWETSSKPIALTWHGDSDALAKLKEVLGTYGADTKKIDSLAKSIDYGERFTVTIPVIPQEQGKLF